MVKRSRFAFARDGAGHQSDREQLQDEPDNSRNNVIDETLFRVVEHYSLGRPRFHQRDELLADLHRQLFAQLDHFVRQILDDKVALFHLEIGQTFLHSALRCIGSVDVAPIEVKGQRFRITSVQGIAPALWNNQRGLDAMSEKIGFVGSVRRALAPLKCFILQHDVDKTLGARRVVAIDQQAGTSVTSLDSKA